jgi:hypothetical protein
MRLLPFLFVICCLFYSSSVEARRRKKKSSKEKEESMQPEKSRGKTLAENVELELNSKIPILVEDVR